MKVFISWSGEPSQSIAHALRDWLPSVAQHVVPWMSEEEIKSGARWNEQVAKALDETDFGIVCVTGSNQHAPWLIFEAGALAKRLDAGRVVPLCVDIPPSEVTGPLAAFQGRTLDEAGMRKLVQDVMAVREMPLSPERVNELFEAMWTTLESKVNAALQQSPDPEVPRRSTKDMLEELVDRVRRIERQQPFEVDDLFTALQPNQAAPSSPESRQLRAWARLRGAYPRTAQTQASAPSPTVSKQDDESLSQDD